VARGVAVTGLGVVGSFGCGSEGLEQALAASRPQATDVDRSAGYHLPDCPAGAALADVSRLSEWVSAASARRMSPPSKFAVGASRMALHDAGVGEGAIGMTAVVLSTAFGPASFTERLLRGIHQEGPEAASPFLFTECVANAPAAQVAIACQATGPNITITQREAGPLQAVARGASEVASGRVARALVGASEEAPPVLHAFLGRFGVLCRREPRPFDRDRDGFLLAEGAAVLVLEDEDQARARGARVHARIRGWGSAFDPTASRVGWGHGEAALAEALRRTLRRSGLQPRDVDLVVSGASGSSAGDRLESLTLRRAWEGERLPPVVAPKGVTGEHGGGFLAAAVLAARGAEIGPSPGFHNADPELGLTPHPGGPLAGCRHVLVTSLAAGGAASWLVLEAA
jgi:3-oxoacyl-[acyl-carrier-protein] synthase II